MTKVSFLCLEWIAMLKSCVGVEMTSKTPPLKPIVKIAPPLCTRDGSKWNERKKLNIRSALKRNGNRVKWKNNSALKESGINDHYSKTGTAFQTLISSLNVHDILEIWNLKPRPLRRRMMVELTYYYARMGNAEQLNAKLGVSRVV